MQRQNAYKSAQINYQTETNQRMKLANYLVGATMTNANANRAKLPTPRRRRRKW